MHGDGSGSCRHRGTHPAAFGYRGDAQQSGRPHAEPSQPGSRQSAAVSGGPGGATRQTQICTSGAVGIVIPLAMSIGELVAPPPRGSPGNLAKGAASKVDFHDAECQVPLHRLPLSDETASPLLGVGAMPGHRVSATRSLRFGTRATRACNDVERDMPAGRCDPSCMARARHGRPCAPGSG